MTEIALAVAVGRLRVLDNSGKLCNIVLINGVLPSGVSPLAEQYDVYRSYSVLVLSHFDLSP